MNQLHKNNDTESILLSKGNLMVIKHSHLGPILAVLILILLLVLGGLYLWGSKLSEVNNTNTRTAPEPLSSQAFNNNEPETPRAFADAQIFKTVSPSDELSAIEADLESSNFDSLGSELDIIDAEMNSALIQ